MNNDATNAVMEVQKSFWQALQTKDRDLFEHILSETYVCRWVNADAEDRATFIQNLLSFPGTITSVEGEQMAVSFIGETAILTAVQVATMQLPNGAEAIDRIALTTLFTQTNDEWQMAFTHAVNIPASNPEN